MQVICKNEVERSSGRIANTVGFISHPGRSNRYLEREYNRGTRDKRAGI